MSIVDSRKTTFLWFNYLSITLLPWRSINGSAGGVLINRDSCKLMAIHFKIQNLRIPSQSLSLERLPKKGWAPGLIFGSRFTVDLKSNPTNSLFGFFVHTEVRFSKTGLHQNSWAVLKRTDGGGHGTENKHGNLWSLSFQCWVTHPSEIR